MLFSTFAQPENNSKKFKPIVQVFGTAAYNFNASIFNYGIGRAHLGFSYSYNENWSAKIIIDRGRPTTIGQIIVTDSAGNVLSVQNPSKEGAFYTMFLKFASLKWKLNDKLSIEGGAILQNHYITQERFWGLRYVAQTFQDMYWFIPSSDLGFIAYYKINDKFSFDAALTNGEGPRVNQDALGKIKYATGFNFNPSSGIKSRIYYHYKQSAENDALVEQLFSIFIGVKTEHRSRIGGEFNYMSNLKSVRGLNSYGFSIYGAYVFSDSFELFARFDRLIYDIPKENPLFIFGNGYNLIGGVSYSPVKDVNLSINYQGWLPDNNTSQNRILLSMAFIF